MNWKYILFDLDGTVTNPKEGITSCVQYALKAAGLPVPPQNELLKFIGPPLVESFQVFSGMTYEGAVEATAKYRERYGTIGLFENELYEGMQDLLIQLKEQGYQISLATCKPEEYSVRILEHFGIKEYFDEIVGATFDESRNTKAAVIREVFLRMGIIEEEKPHVIMVGDRKHDILGAKECGIASLGVYYGFAPEGELEENGADYVVDTIAELADFFKKQ